VDSLVAGAAYSHESALLTGVFTSPTFMMDVGCLATTDFAFPAFFFKILSPYPAVFNASLFESG
jgi:hypothetical protein